TTRVLRFHKAQFGKNSFAWKEWTKDHLCSVYSM
ncbi:uncharacterized, partial [Tachysurus ichikawai]